MQSTKVCCFCERWESGGIESFLYNVLLHMDAHAVQVDIVTAELAESIFTGPLRQRGVRFIELSGSQHALRKNHWLFSQLLRMERYDVVHLNAFHGLSLYYAYLAKQAGIPVRIAHSHNTALRKSRTRILKMLVHHAAKSLFTSSATDLWACSASAAEFLFSKRQLASKGVQFIPNGIDIERFRFDRAMRESVRQDLGLHDKFVIGNVGRLCYQKNQDFLLEIFAEVIRQKPKSLLLLIGKGDAAEELRRKAAMLGIAHAVIFYGASSHVEQLLWAMDVFVFPSRFEGLGIVAVEAQAAGLPVLASAHIPVEARITQQFQTLPLSAGVAQWTERLLKLSHINAFYTEAVERVQRAGFDIKDVAQRMEDFFRNGAAREDDR